MRVLIALSIAVPLVAAAQSPVPRSEVKRALIPWPHFEELSRRPPVAGTVWKANFNRWDGVEPNRRMSIWSDPQNTDSWPHVPSRFGEIVFVD